jgi:hypothetical protein
MAFLPERNFFEETIISSYDFSSGVTDFISSDLSNFITISIQFVYFNIAGENTFRLLQGNDGVNWSYLSEEFDMPLGSGNFSIDKFYFSSKFIKIEFITVDSGTLSIKLLAKR